MRHVFKPRGKFPRACQPSHVSYHNRKTRKTSGTQSLRSRKRGAQDIQPLQKGTSRRIHTVIDRLRSKKNKRYFFSYLFHNLIRGKKITKIASVSGPTVRGYVGVAEGQVGKSLYPLRENRTVYSRFRPLSSWFPPFCAISIAKYYTTLRIFSYFFPVPARLGIALPVFSVSRLLYHCSPLTSYSSGLPPIVHHQPCQP